MARRRIESYDVKGHNVTIPNHMVLARLGYTLKEGAPFAAEVETDYTDAILDSALSVALIRRAIGDHDVLLWARKHRAPSFLNRRSSASDIDA